MKDYTPRGFVLGLFLWAFSHVSSPGQVVMVTMRMDTNRVEVGAETFLRVFAQVGPAHKAEAERIFSWYIDVLNLNPLVASLEHTRMVKRTSDNLSGLSSAGLIDGPHLRAIHDTFMNLAGAGIETPVELLSIPVRARAVGTAQFKVEAGTLQPGISGDFLVASRVGEIPLRGGDYRERGKADAEVFSSECAVLVEAEWKGSALCLEVRFQPCPGKNHEIEYAEGALTGEWKTLPGGPYNSGKACFTPSGAVGFLRVRLTD